MSLKVKFSIAQLLRKAKDKLTALFSLHIAEDAILLIIMLQLIVIGVNGFNSSNPILGLRFEGQLIGQLDNSGFRERTNTIIQKYENKPLNVMVADQKSAITMRQLGVDISEKQVQQTLLDAGRTGNVLGRLAYQDQAVFGARNISLENQNFNNETARAYIATLDKKITVAPANAYFTFDARQQKAIVHADAAGRSIDMDAALGMLRQASPEQHAAVILPTKTVGAQVTAIMLEPLLPEVQAVSQKPLTIIAGESRITLSPEQLVGLVIPKINVDPKGNNKPTAQLTFDEAKLNAIIDDVLKRAVVAPQPTIMSGGKVVREGKPGVRTEDSHSLTRILSVLIQRQARAAAPDEAVIPLVVVPPQVVQQVVSSPQPRTRTGTGHVRLTFDDGPGAYTEQVLDILKRYNVHATFYVIGRNVERYPGTMRRIASEGHRLGNHSYSHADLARLSRAGVLQELSSTQNAIRQTSGVTPTAFRPPYGSLNGTVRDVAASLGMSVDLWSVDTRDWAQPGSSVIAQRAISGAGPGAVILLHVLHQQSVNALPSIIEGIRAQGYTLE